MQDITTTPQEGTVLSSTSSSVKAAPVSCAQITKLSSPDLEIQSVDLTKEKIKVPVGYAIATDPFKLRCNGDELALTLNIPEGFTDLRVIRCRAGECSTTIERQVARTTMVCGGQTTSETVAVQQKAKRPSFRSTQLQAVKTTEKAMLPPGGVLETTGAKVMIEGLGSPAQASIGLPTSSVLQPENPGISLVGIPFQFVLKDATPGTDITIMIDIPATEDLDATTVTMAQWTGARWRFLEADVNGTTATLRTNASALLRDEKAVISLIGSVCTTCKASRLEEAYVPAGAKDAVVLVHGLFSDPSTYDSFIEENKLTKQPFALYTFGYPFNQSLEESGRQLADALERIQAPYKTISIVGHSGGGLVSQYAVRDAADSHGHDPSSHLAITKIDRVLLVGVPNRGILSSRIIRDLGNVLLNARGSSPLFNVDAKVFQEVVAPDPIQPVPGIRYIVIAGTADYGLPFEEALKKAFSTDGIVSTASAQQVGDTVVNDKCRDYFEINLTHTELIDNDVAIRLIARQLYKGKKASAALGYNQYLQVPIEKCDPRDSYWVIGRPMPPEKAPQPLECGCGNGFCGVDEDAVSCPQDCARVVTKENIGRYVLLIEVTLPALSLLVLLLGPTLRVLRRKKPGKPTIVIFTGLLIVETLVGVADALTIRYAPLFMAAVVAAQGAALIGLLRYSRGMQRRLTPAASIDEMHDHAAHVRAMDALDRQLDNITRRSRDMMRRLFPKSDAQTDVERAKPRTMRLTKPRPLSDKELADVRRRLEALKRRLKR